MGSHHIALANSLTGFRAEWYQTEKNTAVLVKAVLQSKKVSSLRAEDLWSLLKLTWITSRGQKIYQDHWKTLKVPALAQLFGCEPLVLDTLKASIDEMPLPAVVAKAAIRDTGIVIFAGCGETLSWIGAKAILSNCGSL